MYSIEDRAVWIRTMRDSQEKGHFTVLLERVDSILFQGDHGIHYQSCKPDVFQCVGACTHLLSFLMRVLIAEQG